MLRTLLLVAVAVVSSAMAQDTCPKLLTPRLCNSESVVSVRPQCDNSTITFPDFTPCCRLHVEQDRKCDDPLSQVKCRSMEVSPAICPGDAETNCCFQKSLSMKLHLEFTITNKTCCSNCRCYGDPHCESFEGKADTWVICDARNPKPSNKAQCPMSKATCEQQVDHTGEPCTWTNTPAQKDWSIALMGSPCRHNQSKEITPPQMTMYESKGFSIVLNQGERSIIEDLVIRDGTQQYVLNSQDCFDYAYSSNRTTTPWKDNWGPNGKTPSDPSWLPNKVGNGAWHWSPIDGQDILWEVTSLDSKIDLSVRCTRTPERVAGKIKYGPPRLNVELVEPLDWHDVDRRPNASGFCPAGFITKQGSTANTDAIMKANACNSETDNLANAQALCDPDTTTAGVTDCMIRWCKSYRAPVHVLNPDNLDWVNSCVSDIQTYNWPAEFCALNVFGSRTCDPYLGNCARTAKDCRTDSKCRTCMTDITDDGWKAAITKYDTSSIIVSDENCLTSVSQLKPDLIGQEKGVQIQYLDPATNQWITVYGIPSTTCLKDGWIKIDKEIAPQLFMYPMRIIQCDQKEGGLVGKCASEIGFKSKIEVILGENKIERVWNLFESSELVCNPDKWSDPKGCLGFVPDKVCPCPQ